jgi:hypothetical protein
MLGTDDVLTWGDVQYDLFTSPDAGGKCAVAVDLNRTGASHEAAIPRHDYLSFTICWSCQFTIEKPLANYAWRRLAGYRRCRARGNKDDQRRNNDLSNHGLDVQYRMRGNFDLVRQRK